MSHQPPALSEFVTSILSRAQLLDFTSPPHPTSTFLSLFVGRLLCAFDGVGRITGDIESCCATRPLESITRPRHSPPRSAPQ